MDDWAAPSGYELSNGIFLPCSFAGAKIFQLQLLHIHVSLVAAINKQHIPPTACRALALPQEPSILFSSDSTLFFVSLLYIVLTYPLGYEPHSTNTADPFPPTGPYAPRDSIWPIG